MTGPRITPFHRYDGNVGPTNRHVTVEIKNGAGESLGEFHQTGVRNSSLERVEPGEINGTKTRSTTPKEITDPDAAAEFGGSGFPTGRNKRGNDCVTGACAIANEGKPTGGEIKPQDVRNELGM